MIDESLSLFTDVGEVGIDALIKDPTLKEVPILGSVLNLIKLSLSIQDRIFINKLKSFIDNVEKNKKWKEKFSDPKECKKISKQLIYIIDSSDDEEKIEAIGMLFNHFVQGEITKEHYFYLCDIIKKSYWPILKTMYTIKENRVLNDGSQYDQEKINHLYSLNLFDYSGMTIPQFDSKNNTIKKTGSIILLINTYGDIMRQFTNIIAENKKKKLSTVKRDFQNPAESLNYNTFSDGEIFID